MNRHEIIQIYILHNFNSENKLHTTEVYDKYYFMIILMYTLTIHSKIEN